MTENLCVRCGRPTPDGYADAGCAYRAGDLLHEIADMVPAARDVAHGVARHGPSASGSAESRLPLNLGATQRLDAVQGSLTTWARHVAEERQGATWVWMNEPIVEASLWLVGHVEWMRHRQEAGEFLTDVEAAFRVIRGIARGPAEQKYLGPCGATVVLPDPDDIEATCEGDVYAYRGARVGRCKTCGAEVATSDREAWLDGEVRSHAFRASEIAGAYGVNVNTIRSWAARGQLVPHGHDQLERPLYNVGDVLDLAAADAARRATDQATRARRAAAREAAETGDAA